MNNGDLPPEMRQRIREIIAETLGIDVDKVPHDFESGELNSLGMDSLDLIELVMEIEDEFDSGDDNDMPMPPLAPALL